MGTPDPTDPSGTGNVEVSARIDSVLANAGLSIDDPAITMFYTVTGTPDSIAAVFVPVEDNSPEAPDIGPRESLAPSLPASGVNAFFEFIPALAGIGFFRVGIEVTTDGQTIEAFSDGVIQVQGRPDPCFAQPCNVAAGGAAAGQTFDACGGLVCDQDFEVTFGDDGGVAVFFDAGDPEGDVQWRLFHLGAGELCTGAAGDLGTQILTGSGNAASVAFLTALLPVGEYPLGVSTTDSGMSVAETVEFDGDDGRIVTVCGPVVKIVE